MARIVIVPRKRNALSDESTLRGDYPSETMFTVGVPKLIIAANLGDNCIITGQTVLVLKSAILGQNIQFRVKNLLIEDQETLLSKNCTCTGQVELTSGKRWHPMARKKVVEKNFAEEQIKIKSFEYDKVEVGEQEDSSQLINEIRNVDNSFKLTFKYKSFIISLHLSAFCSYEIDKQENLLIDSLPAEAFLRNAELYCTFPCWRGIQQFLKEIQSRV